jgi:hypothetical protein
MEILKISKIVSRREIFHLQLIISKAKTIKYAKDLF